MNKNELMEENYVGIDVASKFLGIKIVTLRKWIKTKSDLPVHRVGKLWRFKISELDEWILSGKSAKK